jgi:hypothetical protein
MIARVPRGVRWRCECLGDDKLDREFNYVLMAD